MHLRGGLQSQDGPWLLNGPRGSTTPVLSLLQDASPDFARVEVATPCMMGETMKASGKPSVYLARTIAGLSLTLILAGVVLGAAAIFQAGNPVGLLSHQLTIPVSGVVFSLLGGLVLARHPRHVIAWLLAGIGLISGLEMLNIGFLTLRSLSAPGELIPAPAVSHWLAQWIWMPRAMVSITLLLLFFPDGRLPSRRWRPIAWASASAIALATLTEAFRAKSWPGLGGIVWNPFGIQSGLLERAVILSAVLLTFCFVASLASVLVRFRGAAGVVRLQLKWMVYTVGLVVVLLVLTGLLTLLPVDERLVAELTYSAVNLTAAFIATAVGIAVLRYRLFDIDLIINRTLVYIPLTILVIGSYVVIVGSLGALFQARSSLLISLAATGVIAVLFQPMRDRLQRTVNRKLYGDRDEPYRVLSQLGQRLGGASKPGEILQAIVDTVARTLKLPYVAVSMSGEIEVEQSSGSARPEGEMIELPLRYRNRLVGHLRCGQRSPDEPFSEAEANLLQDIANQVAVAVYALQLSADLQRSRERIVSAREEERRRLRRDLHDGLGPQLASLGLKIDAARNQIEHDPLQATEILGDLRWEVKDAIADIRRLVYDLRPPVLDELGLTGALRASAVAQLSPAGSEVTVEGPERIPHLPAAVEVAAYRIGQEAVTNVARHARAKHCTVRLQIESDLQMEIRDDGEGLPELIKAGVGLTSMEERASELGGRFVIEGIQTGGTRVFVQFPLGTDRS